MPYCPNCKNEYIQGVAKCADCGTDLVENIPEEELSLLPEEELEVVYTCTKLYEAEMLKSNLEGAGIDSFILAQEDTSFPTDGDLSVTKVLVKISDVKAAIEFIESFNNSDINKEENS